MGTGQLPTGGRTCSSLSLGTFQAAGRDPRTPTRPRPRAGSGPPGNARCSSRPSPNAGSQASCRSRRPEGTDTPRWRLRDKRRVQSDNLKFAKRHSPFQMRAAWQTAGAAGAGGDGTSSVTRTRLTAEASPRGRNRKRRRLPTDLSANPRARERARRTRPRRRSASRGSPKAWASQRAWGQTRGRTASSVSFFPPKGSGPTTSCKRPFPRRRPRAERAQDASETAPLRAT